MKGLWAGCLGLTLGCLANAVRGDDDVAWRTKPAKPAAEQSAKPWVSLGAPMASLGRPVAASAEPTRDENVVRSSHDDLPRPIFRGQNPGGYASPTLSPPMSPGGVPVTPDERFNCGVVMDHPN